MKFVSKRKLVNAVQFLGVNEGMPDFISVKGIRLDPKDRIAEFHNKIHDSTLEVNYGDFIVWTDDGDRWPCKAEIFERYYCSEEDEEGSFKGVLSVSLNRKTLIDKQIQEIHTLKEENKSLTNRLNKSLIAFNKFYHVVFPNYAWIGWTNLATKQIGDAILTMKQEYIEVNKEEKILPPKPKGCICTDPFSGEWKDISYYCPLHGR